MLFYMRITNKSEEKSFGDLSNLSLSLCRELLIPLTSGHLQFSEPLKDKMTT